MKSLSSSSNSSRPLKNVHAEEMLQYLKKSGATDIDHGATHILAQSYDPNDATNEDKSTLGPNTKIIHFQRHGQAYHNFMYEFMRQSGAPLADVYDPDPEKNMLVRPEVTDAPLTELGRQQSADKQQEASMLNPELVVVSPLHRTLQTALITFQDFRSRVPFVAHEACREELGLLRCNMRRPLSHTIREFPDIDFSEMATTAEEHDTLWDPNARECPKKKSRRIYRFLVDYIQKRPEREIAVVAHSAWLFSMANTVLDCAGDFELMDWYTTSEIRTMKLTFSGAAR